MPTGWKGSNRRQTLPTGWPVTVLRILLRDHHRCQWVREDTGRRCLAKARQVDHILRPEEGGTEDDANLRALCEWHHNRKSGREGGIASGKAKRARADATKPIHPGLLPLLDRNTPSTQEAPPPF